MNVWRAIRVQRRAFARVLRSTWRPMLAGMVLFYLLWALWWLAGNVPPLVWLLAP